MPRGISRLNNLTLLSSKEFTIGSMIAAKIIEIKTNSKISRINQTKAKIKTRAITFKTVPVEIFMVRFLFSMAKLY